MAGNSFMSKPLMKRKFDSFIFVHLPSYKRYMARYTKSWPDRKGTGSRIGNH
jgi:hypothetical protein